MKFKGLLFLLFAFSLTAQSQTTKKISQPEKILKLFGQLSKITMLSFNSKVLIGTVLTQNLDHW